MILEIQLCIIIISLYFFKKIRFKESFRDSNLELLRIISMLLIVTHHYALHGFNFLNLDLTSNKIVLNFLVSGGKIGVNIFILLSAYFLSTSNFNIKK